MNEKYYTPTITEMHIGLEYEWRRIESDEPFAKAVIMDGVQIDDIYNTVYDLRLKILDKEDIESLGFSHIGGKLIESVGQTYTKFNGRNYVHLNASRFSQWMSIRVEASVEEDSVRTVVVHSIRIKNKSELSKLLKQLNLV